MTVGCGPSRQLVLKMGEPLPGGCSGGKQGWGCWTQSLGSAPTRVLTPLMLGTASSAPSCQAGSQHLAMAQGIANSLRASGSSVTGTDGELEGWVMCVTPLCDLNKVSLVCILGTRYTVLITVATICCYFFHLILTKAQWVGGFSEEETEVLRPK